MLLPCMLQEESLYFMTQHAVTEALFNIFIGAWLAKLLHLSTYSAGKSKCLFLCRTDLMHTLTEARFLLS